MANLETRVCKLEKEVDRIAVIMPEELREFFEGKRDTSEDRERFFALFNAWMEKVKAALARGSITLMEAISLLPKREQRILLQLLTKREESTS